MLTSVPEHKSMKNIVPCSIFFPPITFVKKVFTTLTPGAGYKQL